MVSLPQLNLPFASIQMYISYVSTSRSLYIEYELLPADSFFKMFLFETFVSSKYSVGISQNDLGGQQ